MMFFGFPLKVLLVIVMDWNCSTHKIKSHLNGRVFSACQACCFSYPFEYDVSHGYALHGCQKDKALLTK